MTTTRSACETCDADLSAVRAATRKPARPARYCSNACRQRAYRTRADGATNRLVLPVPPDLFIGRDAELADLARLIGQTRLLSIVGSAGIGKTRLSCELVGRVKRSFPGGVHLAELAAASGADLVPSAVAAAVGVPPRTGMPVIDALAAELADRKALLVLDCCEHVLAAAGALVEALLRRCSRLVVLVTSRETLRLRGETVFRLGGLAVDGDDEDDDTAPGGRLDGPAVRLLLDRARASAPGFAPTGDDAAHIVALCRRLDGVPLAIEVAARAARLLPVAEIADRMDDWLPLPTLGPSSAECRHHSLRAAMDWGHRLLQPEEQVAFRRLAVLAGGFDLDAARSVCADGALPAPEVLALLAALDAKSLIEPVAGHPRGRYRMRESERRYGLERLRAADDEAATSDRLVRWLTDLAAPILDRATLCDAIVRRLRDEQHNLLAALERLDGTGDERQLLLAGALVVARFRTGDMTQAREWLTRALDSTDPESRYRGFALATAAWLAAWLDEPDRALALALDGLALERRWMRPAMLARLHRVAAHGWRELGQGGAATESLRECLRLCRLLGDRIGAAHVLHMLATSALEDGDLGGAAEALDEALPVARAAADVGVLRATLYAAGVLAVERDDLPEAGRLFAESLRYYDEAALNRWCPVEGLAVVAVRAGRAEHGLRLLAAARQLRQGEGPGAAASPPWWRRRVDEAEAAARAELPARRADAAVEAGNRLGPAEAVDWALADPGRGTGGGPAGGDGGESGRLPAGSPLGGREWHVATLVAQGLTNGQIAGRLHVSLRTVEAHVRNIRVKLDLRSRAHLAAWFTEHAAGHDSVTLNLNGSSS